MVNSIFGEGYKAELNQIIIDEKELIRKKFKEKVREVLKKSLSEAILDIELAVKGIYKTKFECEEK